jgi:hypothetical protein
VTTSKKAHIKAEIEQRMKKREERAIITAEEVVTGQFKMDINGHEKSPRMAK